MKKLILLGVIGLALAGCNTVAGLGDDVSGSARMVQNWIS